MNNATLNNRIFLITGAAGGLGSALAIQLAQAGAQLVLLDKNRPGLEALADQIAEAGSAEPGLYPMDLEGASPDDFLDLKEALEQELGGLDSLIHCAARFTGLFPTEHLAGDEWLRCLQVNLNAPWMLSKTCLPLLRASDQAQIVWTLDSEERVSTAHWGAYGVAKQGIRALVGQMQSELEPTGIAVAGINPGPMDTTLRSQAYVADDPENACNPIESATKIVRLLIAGPVNGIVDFEKDQ